MLLKKGDGFEYILAMKRTKQYLSINVHYAYLGVAFIAIFIWETNWRLPSCKSTKVGFALLCPHSMSISQVAVNQFIDPWLFPNGEKLWFSFWTFFLRESYIGQTYIKVQIAARYPIQLETI
jgi:hypothetical protein